MEIKVFAYGTLKYRDIVQAVLGRRWSGTYHAAQLPNYCLLPTSPAFIVPAFGHFVDGLILDDLDEGDFAALDHFEGVAHDMYQRHHTQFPGFGRVYYYEAGRSMLRYLSDALKYDYPEYDEILRDLHSYSDWGN